MFCLHVGTHAFQARNLDLQLECCLSDVLVVKQCRSQGRYTIHPKSCTEQEVQAHLKHVGLHITWLSPFTNVKHACSLSTGPDVGDSADLLRLAAEPLIEKNSLTAQSQLFMT